MTDSIASTLVSVGLTQKEASVFLALLALGQGSASTIAERAGIKRSIAYHTLQSLVDRGFALEIPGQKVKRYGAVSPTRLLQYVQANTENLRMILPLLRGLEQQSDEKPLVEVHEGKEAVLAIYRSMEFAKHSRYLTCWNHLEKEFPEEVKRWSINAASPKNPNEVKNLIIDDAMGREMLARMKKNTKQQFRLLPKETKFEMNFGIADNTLAITSFKPLFVVVIHSSQVTACAALLFDLAWNSVKPLNTNKKSSQENS